MNMGDRPKVGMDIRMDIGLLAGGKNSRIGGLNKAFLKYKNQYLLDILAGELAPIGRIVLSAGVSAAQLYTGAGANPHIAAVVEDREGGMGPLEGIRQLLRHCADGDVCYDAGGSGGASDDAGCSAGNCACGYMFICAVDMPFVKKELVRYMAEFISSDYDCYLICDTSGLQPLGGIYSTAMLPRIEAALAAGVRRVIDALDMDRTKQISLTYTRFSEAMLRNINTPEDCRALLVKPMVFCVSGIKNSGKTTLIENLIGAFSRRFRKIAVVKHDGHSFEADIPGKDTWRYSEAGAHLVAMFSDSKYFIINNEESAPLDSILAELNDPDVVIIEGMKGSPYPKVEIVRRGISDACVCDPSTLIGVATDTKVRNLAAGVALLDLNDAEAITEAVVSYFHVSVPDDPAVR